MCNPGGFEAKKRFRIFSAMKCTATHGIIGYFHRHFISRFRRNGHSSRLKFRNCDNLGVSELIVHRALSGGDLFPVCGVFAKMTSNANKHDYILQDSQFLYCLVLAGEGWVGGFSGVHFPMV